MVEFKLKFLHIYFIFLLIFKFEIIFIKFKSLTIILYFIPKFIVIFVIITKSLTTKRLNFQLSKELS